MATLPTKVQPGDLITSELVNAMLEDLAQLKGSAGTQTVPDVFGRFLPDARTIINQPSKQLTLGTVLDVAGAVIDPLASANAILIVLGQSPVSGTRVAPGTSVNLVVSRAATGGGTTLPPPTITRTETAIGTPATKFRVGDPVVIVGTNFHVTPSQNIVTFDGVGTPVTSDPSDPTRRLLVKVPTGISGGPVNPGDPDKTGVILVVSTPAGVPVSTTITVAAPSGVPVPQITSFTPPAQAVGANVTISGQNFSATASRNEVSFGNVAAASIVSVTPTDIVAKVPDFPDLPNVSGSTKDVQIRVTVKDASGTVIGTDVTSGTLTVVRP